MHPTTYNGVTKLKQGRSIRGAASRLLLSKLTLPVIITRQTNQQV
jgi:hypothetical protein